MSPSLSRTNSADVPGFIRRSTSRTKSSSIPTVAETRRAGAAHHRADCRSGQRHAEHEPGEKTNECAPCDVGNGWECFSVERERSVGVPHDHGDVLENEVVLVPPKADDLVADGRGLRHVVVADCPQVPGRRHDRCSPLARARIGAPGGVGRRTIHPPWIETGDEPDERPVELQALLDSRDHLVGRRAMPDGRQRVLGRAQRGGEIGGRTRCARSRRIRQAFERRRDGLLEILNGRRAIREQPPETHGADTRATAAPER